MEVGSVVVGVVFSVGVGVSVGVVELEVKVGMGRRDRGPVREIRGVDSSSAQRVDGGRVEVTMTMMTMHRTTRSTNTSTITSTSGSIHMVRPTGIVNRVHKSVFRGHRVSFSGWVKR